jgi:anti-sigma-K factor RskA
MIRDHEAIEELLAVRALGALEGDDLEALERELESHGACEECARLRDEFDETAGRLAFALEPEAVDPEMADRILAFDRDEAAKPRAPDGEIEDLALRRARGWRRALAVAASFVVLVAGVAIIRSDGGTVVALPTQRFLELDGEEGTSFAIAYTPGEAGVIVWGQDLPDPGAERVYELWAITGGTAVSQGCLRPAGGGIAAFLDTEIGDAEVMAVTVESASCPDAPTTDPVYAGELA